LGLRNVALAAAAVPAAPAVSGSRGGRGGRSGRVAWAGGVSGRGSAVSSRGSGVPSHGAVPTRAPSWRSARVRTGKSLRLFP
jgi:hypothetical protein